MADSQSPQVVPVIREPVFGLLGEMSDERCHAHRRYTSRPASPGHALTRGEDPQHAPDWSLTNILAEKEADGELDDENVPSTRS